MSFLYFTEDLHASTYNKFRPDPPQTLIKRIVEYTSEKVLNSQSLKSKYLKFSEPLKLAVDVGCGSGQSTEVLAPYFEKVLGLDPSIRIINEAKKKCKHPNVFYSTSPAESLNVDSLSANLISACQAIHWFDIPKFYSEAERILMPNGVIAVYGYKLPVPVYKNNREIESIIEKYYTDVLGSFTWPQSRQVYLENYSSKEFNEVFFVEGGKMQREENFWLETEGDLNDIIGYIKSWSAFQNYYKQKGKESAEKIIKKFKEDFSNILNFNGDFDDKLTIKFNYFLLLGRKK